MVTMPHPKTQINPTTHPAGSPLMFQPAKTGQFEKLKNNFNFLFNKHPNVKPDPSNSASPRSPDPSTVQPEVEKLHHS